MNCYYILCDKFYCINIAILQVRFSSIGDSSQPVEYCHEQNMLTILTSSYTRPASCAHEQKAMHYALRVGTVHKRSYDI